MAKPPQTRPRSVIALLCALLTVLAALGWANFVLAQDITPPTIECTAPDQSVWYSSDVSVPCTASDGDGSGLANSEDAAFTLATTVPDDTETANADTGTKTVCDVDGNCATAGPYTFKVDKKAPEITCTVPDTSIWYGTDVDVPCSASDGGSGLADSGEATFTLSTSVASGTETASAPTGSKSVSDGVGNTATAGPYTFNVDKKAPEVTCNVPDASIWYGSDVTVPCTASDDGSGLADTANASFNLSTNVAPDAETSSASTDSKTVNDGVGNSVTAGPYVFMVDKKAPAVTITSPTGPYAVNQQVYASFTCTDGGSGVASCSGTVADGDPIDTSSAAIGPHSFSVTAADNLGNSATQTSAYSVQYSQITGRTIRPPLQQISDPSQLTKTGKLGRTLPIKFQLFDDTGAPIGTATATLKLYTVDGTEAPVEDSGKSNGGTNVFRYDPIAQQYIYNLSTKKLSPGIYQIVITLDDGTQITSYFKLRK